MSFTKPPRLLPIILLVLLLLSACVPVTPAPTVMSSVNCSDDDKLALIESFMHAHNEEADAAPRHFTPDGVWNFDGPPQWNEAAGTFQSDPQMARRNTGHDEIRAQAAGLINAAVEIALITETINLNDNVVTAIANGFTPYYAASPWFMPLSRVQGAYTFTIEDCKLSSVLFAYTDETIAALNTARTDQQAIQCTDNDKAAILLQYAEGVSNGDVTTATQAFAEDAHLRFDGPPLLDEQSGSYVIDPSIQRNFRGHDEIGTAFTNLISVGLQLVVDMESLAYDGRLVTAWASAATPAYAGAPFSLPLTELSGTYTVNVDINCRLAYVYFAYPKETLQALKTAAAN